MLAIYFVFLFASLRGLNLAIVTKIESTQYILNPLFGNVTMDSSNVSHIGAVNFWFITKITDFTVNHLMELDGGKVIFNGTSFVCDKRASSRMDKLMRMTLGINKTTTIEELIPITWICPIIKGAAIIKPEPRITEFGFFVPSFFSNDGKVTWTQNYLTKSNGKSVMFLNSVKQMTIEKK